MPLVHRSVTPIKLSSTKLNIGKNESEFLAVNNGTLVNTLKQLASLVSHAGDIFTQISIIAAQVSGRAQSIKLRLDELEAKVELFDPKLVPVPEGTLEDEPVSHKIRADVVFDAQFFLSSSRPPFLVQLYEKSSKQIAQYPLRSPVLNTKSRHNVNSSENCRRPASIAALRDWKLDDYVDEKLTTLERKKRSTPEELNQTVSGSFGPSQVVQVDVTGSGFDRMKSNRRSLIIHTKKIRTKKKRRNTICGAMPNKECGIQTSFSSVISPSENKKYGIDSGHWSCTNSAVGGASSTSAPSPWDPNSIATSSDFLYDDEDRSLTPQLENFTDGLVSDSDCSVDSAGFFTSFRNDCGFPKSKKSLKEREESSSVIPSAATTESEYELFGKGSTSSCGTVVLRRKPELPMENTQDQKLEKKSQSDDVGWEERVKRKSLIEIVPSMVVVTPSPSCSLNGGSPLPLKECGAALEHEDSGSEDRLTPKVETDTSNESETATLSDNDIDIGDDVNMCEPPDIPPRDHVSSSNSNSSCSSNATISSSNNQNCQNDGRLATTHPCSNCLLPKPDVIPDVQQLQIIRTSTTPKLKSGQDYVALENVHIESINVGKHQNASSSESLDSTEGKLGNNNSSIPGVSSKIRGAKVVLDPNGEIIFSSETLRRKKRQKISFDPGASVKPTEYDKSSYNRVRESIYERLRPDKVDNEIYECIEKIRQHNLKESKAIESKYDSLTPLTSNTTTELTPACTTSEVTSTSSTSINASHSPGSTILETDLDNLPPVMPELETLPRIKDRLKRNESYRMANEELTLRPLLSSTSSRNNNKNIKPSSSSIVNNNIKKRDIPEEDPVFIQQVLNLNSSTNSLRSSSSCSNSNLFGRINNAHSNNNNNNNNLIISPSSSTRLPLTPDDRPSFLRRESPPSMDSITKEIYRFRKKFNIQPNASSTSLISKPSFRNLRQTSLQYENQTPAGKKIPPIAPVRNLNSSPLLTSTPIRSTGEMRKTNSGSVRQPFFGRKQVYSSLKQSGTPAFEQKKGNLMKSVTFQFSKDKVTSDKVPNGIDTIHSPSVPGLLSKNHKVLDSLSSSRSPNSLSNSTSSNSSSSGRLGTSLSDFKKLLQSARYNGNSKKSSISAVEILKPKIGVNNNNNDNVTVSNSSLETTL